MFEMSTINVKIEFVKILRKKIFFIVSGIIKVKL